MAAILESRKKLNQAGDLPPLSQVGLEISRLGEGDDITAAQLARLISKDAVLAAKVLRIANSPFYGLRHQIKTLDHAIMVLGQVNIASICAAFTLLGALKIPKAPGHERYKSNALRSHSILTAIFARWMAQHMGSPHVPITDSFLGGLFHDIGELAIAVYYPTHLEDLRQYEQAHPDISSCQAEQTILGFDHQELGAEILHHWHLPQLYINVAQHHHTAATAVGSDESLMVVLLQAADQAAVMVQNEFHHGLTSAQTLQEKPQDFSKTVMSQIPGMPPGSVEKLDKDLDHILVEARMMIEQGNS